MRVGDVIETKSVVAVSGEHGRHAPMLSATFAPPKEYRFELMFLGMKKVGEEFDPAAALNSLGWVLPAEEKTVEELDSIHKLLKAALRHPSDSVDCVKAALTGLEKLYGILYLKPPEEPTQHETIHLEPPRA